MKPSDRPKLPSQPSAETRRLNPQLFGTIALESGTVTPKSGTIPSKCGTKKPARAKEPNATEREYWHMLMRQYRHGESIRWEAYTLRLASRVNYTPDFSVVHADGSIEFHEVKGGYIFPKALVKLRTCAGQFPHKFFLAQKLKTGWEIIQLAANPTPP